MPKREPMTKRKPPIPRFFLYVDAERAIRSEGAGTVGLDIAPGVYRRDDARALAKMLLAAIGEPLVDCSCGLARIDDGDDGECPLCKVLDEHADAKRELTDTAGDLLDAENALDAAKLDAEQTQERLEDALEDERERRRQAEALSTSLGCQLATLLASRS